MSGTRREALSQSLSGRFWLRWHASVIVSATFGAGFGANFLLLRVPVHSAVLRWPLAVLAGYVAFFGLVRLWLAYVGVKPLGGASRRALDEASSGIDLPGGGPGGGGSSIGDIFRGGGGRSGGGGASAGFGSSNAAGGGQGGFASLSSGGNAGPAAGGGASKSGGWFGKIGGGSGSALDGLGDNGCLPIILGLIVLALVVALVGGAIHLIWIAPELLTDAAFAAMLSAGALPGLRRVDEPDWNGRVFRSTLPVLAVVLVVVVAAGLAFGHYFPGLRTLGEAWDVLSRGSR